MDKVTAKIFSAVAKLEQGALARAYDDRLVAGYLV
jgi:hypothetical protein